MRCIDMYGLADCNNFFVSCERVRDTSLQGQAVVVLSNNDGCVVSRSNEAKQLGVKMGQPAFQIRHLIERGIVKAISGHHLLYRDFSIKVHDIFRRYVPATKDYSVDEAFFDMDGVPSDQLKSIGMAIYNQCLNDLRLPVTVGFAPTRTLAKLVTERCKRKNLPVGVLCDTSAIMPVLPHIPISELWGIGRRLTKRLYQCGVYTIGEFASKSREWVAAKMGVPGERSWLELHGIPCIELDAVDRPLQDSISETRTFPEDIEDFDYLRARLSVYATDCADKLRKMKGVCRTIGVFLACNRFKTYTDPYSPSVTVQLDRHTDDTMIIVAQSLELLGKIYRPVPFKRAGVWLEEIMPKECSQFSIFDSLERKQDFMLRDRLMGAVDRINLSANVSGIRLASQFLNTQQNTKSSEYISTFHAPKK